MSKKKKLIREAFRNTTLMRDGNKCRVCSKTQSLDAHHITDRSLMPNGGYVKENGITLCPTCHINAEIYHSTGTALEGFHPDDLYKLISSSFEIAYQESLRLK